MAMPTDQKSSIISPSFPIAFPLNNLNILFLVLNCGGVDQTVFILYFVCHNSPTCFKYIFKIVAPPLTFELKSKRQNYGFIVWRNKMLSKWIHVAIDTLSNVDFNVCFLRVDYLETVETRKENKIQLESYIQRKLFKIYKKLF
jgi:hypothetical protein